MNLYDKADWSATGSVTCGEDGPFGKLWMSGGMLPGELEKKKTGFSCILDSLEPNFTRLVCGGFYLTV